MNLKSIFFSVALLICASSFSQNGINYKAVVKDDNGNVLVSSPISMQFIIYEGAALTNNVYQESHTINTDANGFVVVNIGEGTTGDVFTDINWGNDEHFLNVQVNTGSGLIDLGTTQFMHVPYAIQAEKAENVSGLEAIDEGNSTGWRLIGANPNYHGDIGGHAVDFSYQQSESTRGSTGNFSFSAGGLTYASGEASAAFGIGTRSTNEGSFSTGTLSEASGENSTAMGYNTKASGSSSFAIGNDSEASGDFSTAIGRGLTTNYNSVAIGRYNVGFVLPSSWSEITPLFEIGNGTSDSDRNNALTVYKSGRMRINSTSSGLIINSASAGLEVYSDGFSGIRIHEGNNYGGTFRGEEAAIFAKATNNANPDIILGGDFDNDNDDGVIASDQLYSSSDIFLRSNDDIVLELDNDNNESGVFRIRNSSASDVFTANESGNVNMIGRLQIGDETIEDTGSNQLTFGASVVPSNNNAYRLGNSTTRWIGVWATDGTINTSDRREKKNIRDLEYGLAEVLKMKPVSFNWKAKNIPDTKLGLIAQDLINITPEVVKSHIWEKEETTGELTKKELDRLGVYYSDLVPVLIKAIQEQQDTIEALKSTIQNQNQFNTKQSKVLEALLSRVDALEQSNN